MISSRVLLLEGYLVTAAEAADPNSAARRAAAGGAAGREVQTSINALDRSTVETLLRRLQQLKRELQGVIAASGTDFRRFTAQSLIAEVDRLIADATRDLSNTARSTFASASRLGVSAVEEPIKAARISLTPAPRLDARLVTSAFELTSDLLTEPMQQFRNQVVRQIRRATTLGTGTTDAMRTLAQQIDRAGFDNARFRAERIVRTEVSRVLNEATFGRLEGLARQMPFLRKGWRASRDSRVRTGHREASEKYSRGNGIRIGEPFAVNVHQEARLAGGIMVPAKLLGTAQMRFPVDPDATPSGRLAAAATIMCRCNAFVDFSLDELRAWSTSRSTTVSPGAPAPEMPRGGFAEPPIDRPRTRPAPTAAVPKAPKAPVIANALQRAEPVRSSIPGGRELLKDYSAAVQAALEEAHRDLFEASGFNSTSERPQIREALQTIKADGSKTAIVEGGRDYVEVTDAVARDIRQSAAWIHTHPSSAAFSFADVKIMATYGQQAAMIVYGRSGSWYELRAPASFSYQNRDFVASTLGQANQDYNVEIFKAVNRAKYRTEKTFPELARERGVSTLQVAAGAANDEEIQELFQLYFQEEAVDALKVFAAKYGLSFRYYLPPAPTTNAKNRSRESVAQLEASSRRPAIDDWPVERGNRYLGPDKVTPAQAVWIAELKKLGVEIDVKTGERRLSRQLPPATTS